MTERIWYYLGRDEGDGKPSLLEDFESLDPENGAREDLLVHSGSTSCRP